MSFSIRSADYHREGGDMVSQPPGSPREELPDDDAQYAAFVDEMPSADGRRKCCKLAKKWYMDPSTAHIELAWRQRHTGQNSSWAAFHDHLENIRQQ